MKHLNHSSTKSAILNPKPVVSDIEPSKILSFFLLFTSYFLLMIACEKNTTPVTLPNPQLTLTVEDVAVTEAWLKLTVEDRTENLRFTLLRNDSLILNGPLTTDDTTLYDATLLPTHTYTYRAELQKEGQKIAAAVPLNITTIDTTSHNFTWQIDTIGTHSSVLHDVAIINENEIWAVGEIHTAETDTFDSLGNWIPPYNVVYWNGSEWDLIRSEAEGYGFGENYSIFAFSPEDVWIGSTIPEHWDGQQWTFHGSTTGYPGGFRIRKIWGTSSENLYFVGDGGNIVHYNGQSWYRIESGTELDFRDVWGSWNSQGQYWEIVAVASKLYVNYDRLIFQIEPGYALLTDNGINWPLLAVWFSSGRKYYVAGSGIYEKHRLSETQWQNGPLDITHYTIFGMRGNALNDIAAGGGVGEIIHFNGMDWKSFFDVTQLGYGNYYAVDMKGDIIVAVGQDAPRAVIAIGRRYSPEN